MSLRFNRSSRVAGVVLSVALLASACGGGAVDEAATSTAATDAPAEQGSAGIPQLVGATVSGAQIDTNDLAGQDTVIWFWAPW